MSKSTTQRVRNWCFTIHNYTEKDLTHLKSITNDDVKHIIFQEEVCPTTNRRHIQGHVCFENARTMKGVKKFLNNDTVHLEVMRGTPKQSAEYCSKSETAIDGTNHEIGEVPTGQGRRSDIEELVNKINNKQITYEQISNEYPALFLQYRNGLAEKCDMVYGTKRNFKSHVTVLYGASGTGKSRDAFNTEDFYGLRRSKTGVWFDEYNYNNTLVIDDFYGWIEFDFLLRLLDRYAMKVDIKGGAKEFNSPNIVITSNKSPLDWYPNLSNEHKIALLRRIDKCIYYSRKETIDVTKGLSVKINQLCDESALTKKDELVCLSLGLNDAHCTEVVQGNTILEPAHSETCESYAPDDMDNSYCGVKPIVNEDESCLCSEDGWNYTPVRKINNDNPSLASFSGRDRYGQLVNYRTCRVTIDEDGNRIYYRRDNGEAVWFVSKRYGRGAPIYDTSETLSYDWDSDCDCVCLKA